MNTLIPVWILGGPFVALLILAFSFKGSSAMGGSLPRLPPRDRDYRRGARLPAVGYFRTRAGAHASGCTATHGVSD